MSFNVTRYRELLQVGRSTLLEQPFKRPSFNERMLELKRSMDSRESILTPAGKIVTRPERGLNEPEGFLSNTLDVLSRGNFASAKIADVLISEEEFNIGKAWQALKGGAKEFVSPEERLLFRDVIWKANPVWAANNQDKAAVLGFVGDVVIDPLNLIGPGLFKNAPKIALTAGTRAGKIVPLTKPGARFYQRLVDDFSQELPLRDSYSSASEVISSIVEKGIKETLSPEALRKAALTTKEKSVTVEVLAKSLISNGQIKSGDGIRIVDQDYLDAVIKTGKLPDISIDAKTALQKGSVVKVNHEGAFVKGKIFKVKLPRGGIDVVLDDGKVVKKTLDDFRSEDLTKLFLNNKVAFTRASADARALGTIQNIAKNGSSPVLMHVPKKFVGRQDNLGRLTIKPDTSLESVRFSEPLSEQLVSVNSARKNIETLDTQAAKELKDLRRRQRITADAFEGEHIKAGEELIQASGLKILNKTVIRTETFKRFSDFTGLSSMVKTLGNTPTGTIIKTSAKQFQRTFGLSSEIEKHHAEWARFRGSIEHDRNSSLRLAERSYKAIFIDLAPESRIKINTVMSTARASVNSLIQAGKSVSEPQARKLFSASLLKHNANPEEISAMSKLSSLYKQLAETEQKAGLLTDLMLNYNPNRYEVIGSSGALQQFKINSAKKARQIPGARTFTPGEVQKFKDLPAAEKVGDLIVDSGKLMLLRFMEHSSAVRRKRWEDYLVGAYGSLDNVPSAVALDLVRLGEVSYKKGFRNDPNIFLRAWDTLNNAFKMSATVVRPAFIGRQLTGNTSQLFAEFGVSGYKAFDPTVVSDAFGYAVRGEIKYDITTAHNQVIRAEELTTLLKEGAITKGVAVEGIGQLSELRLIKQLTEDVDKIRITKNMQNSAAAAGLRNLLRKGTAYLHIPQLVEDTFRTAGFITALKLGNDPAAALKMVDNAFFNYTSALTETEKGIRRFIIPFYSFQKFGTILLAKTAVTAPGRLALAPKVGRSVSEAWNKIASGEILNDAERASLPGYLLEQPNAFEGFTPEMEAKFRTFNNLTFLDVLSFMQLDDKGNFDSQETLMKGVMAQMSPFIKIPLETLVFKRQFFTDAPLDSVFAGNLGDVDSDRLLANLMTMGGLHFGASGALGGKILGEAGNLVGGDILLQKLLGWEEGFDPRTGKKQVWVNPYKISIAKSILPGLSEAFKVSKQDRNFWDNVLSITFGINMTKIDLQRSASRRLQSSRREFQADRFDLLTKLRQQRIGEDVFEDEASKFLEDLSNTFDSINNGQQIRGPSAFF